MANPVGRPRGIKSPELLWDLFLEYKKEVKSKPFLVHDFVGKDGISVYREKEKCLTMEGFEDFIVESPKTTITFADIDPYLKGEYEEYSLISARIKKRIREDQITGGMAGVYNANLTARLNALSESQNIDITEKRKTALELFPEIPEIDGESD